MTDNLQHPLFFRPLLKRIRWGGRRLETLLGKSLGPEDDYAESWELADHDSDQTLVADGPLAGTSLGELVRNSAAELLGERFRGVKQFPLLVKLLDAHDRLSVQVHPDDAQAAALVPGENGKTECWIILHAEPGSRIYCGLKSHVDETALREAVRTSQTAECLHGFSPCVGDCVFVPAGTVHAITEGIVLAEIQQQSNVTFRLDDWGRLDSDGKARPLHIDQSMQCIDWSRGPVHPIPPVTLTQAPQQREQLVRSEWFNIDRLTLSAPLTISANGAFRVLMVIDGECDLVVSAMTWHLPKGQTVLIPAACTGASVVPDDCCTLLDVTA